MASVAAAKRRAENKSYKIKYKALNELEKGTPHKDVASLFGVPKNALSTWKKNKDKIFEKYNSGLISNRVKPEKYEAMMRSRKKLNFNVEKEYVFNKKQTLILDFFLRQ